MRARGVRRFPEVSCLAFVSLGGCDGMLSLTPYQQVEIFQVEADGRQAHQLLDGLAHQQGLEMDGRLDGREGGTGEAIILTRGCMLLAENSGDVIRLTLKSQAEANCLELRALFDNARHQLGQS